ncbi:MAG: type II toxin-antitoxin system RelE/ParE family toxin [Lachnospiraceae bacterium]|nr:type II toxin-antitoxin system RelE/ParE family toxin [Lachnospiraceae bacterium]
MAYTVAYSPLALQDLLRVRDEVFSACRDKETTDRYMNDLMDAVEAVADFPEIGSPLYYENLFTSYYRISFKAYLIFYRLEEKRLLVERVLYGKTDYLRLLFPEG